jgi:hypothetical protein
MQVKLSCYGPQYFGPAGVRSAPGRITGRAAPGCTVRLARGVAVRVARIRVTFGRHAPRGEDLCQFASYPLGVGTFKDLGEIVFQDIAHRQPAAEHTRPHRTVWGDVRLRTRG